MTGVSSEDDPSGGTNTRLNYTFTLRGADFPSTANPDDYRLLKSSQSSHLYQYVSSSLVPIGQNTIDLESITRQIVVGDPVLVKDPRPIAPNPPQLLSITSYSEVIYYANNPSNPSFPPPQLGGSFSGAPLQAAIPIPHSQLSFTPVLDSPWDATVAQILYGWNEVGQLIDTPAATVSGTGTGSGMVPRPQTSPLTLQPPGDAPLHPPGGTPVLVQDANGKGATGEMDTTTSSAHGQPRSAAGAAAPIQALFNLLTVSRGKTVANEILGSGNSLVAGQDFVLQNAPVTYLQDPRSVSGENYSSTVRVWVNQLEWVEVQSFYGQPPDAQVFITREDEQGQTHVVFGDGQNGARLPTGVNNVVASYRYGSGAAAPAAGSLTVVLQPQPGLRSILNPVAMSRGADPDPPSTIRQLAPQSVTTFGRAISLEDFQTIAALTPGVTRARAAVAFDPMSQRPRVTVWVGDDGGAVTAAQQAFAASADPNRQPRVVLAQAVEMTLSLTVVYNSRYDGPTVMAAVYTALLDPDVGLLGVNVIGIGEVFYDSQVYASCLAVPGVVAVHSLNFVITTTHIAPPYRRLLGSELRRFFPINSSPAQPVRAVPSTCCGQRHDPGVDSYLFLPDVTIGLEASS